MIDKPGKGMFYATEVDDHLKARGITQLVFAGVTTEVCVQTSMREANDRGYECLLIEDATASYFPEFKAAAIAMIRAQGAIVGWTTPLAALRQGDPMTEPQFDADALIDASLPLLGLTLQRRLASRREAASRNRRTLSRASSRSSRSTTRASRRRCITP